MTLTYRSDGAWGAGKGSNLNAAEFDNNTWDHEQRIVELEDNPAVPVGISNFTQSGSQFMQWLSNGDSFGPFDLPIFSPVWRDEWEAATFYFKGDIVPVSGQGLYFVQQDHTSDSVFDPDASNSVGVFYELVFREKGFAPMVTVVTSTYVPTHASSGGKYHRCTSTGDSAGEVVISLTSGAMAVGDEMHFRQCDAGIVTIIEGDTGVVINPNPGFLHQTFGVAALIGIKCIAADTFDVFGGLAEDVSA